MQESIFNLIPQHEQYTAALRRKAPSFLAEHVSVYNANDDPHENIASSNKGYPASSAQRDAAVHQEPVQRGGSKQLSAKPRGAQQELDAAEVARRRQQAQMSGFAMAAALTPEETYRQKMLKSKQVGTRQASIACTDIRTAGFLLHFASDVF
jgi:hypothetical protein